MWISGYYYAEHWRWLPTGQVISSVPDENNYPSWYKNHMNRTEGCILFDRHYTSMHVFVATRCNRKKDFICEQCNLTNKRRSRYVFIKSRNF